MVEKLRPADLMYVSGGHAMATSPYLPIPKPDQQDTGGYLASRNNLIAANSEPLRYLRQPLYDTMRSESIILTGFRTS